MDRNNKGIDITINCEKCGEKIEISNDMGVFCKNLCGYDDSKDAYEKINKIFGELLGKTTLKHIEK